MKKIISGLIVLVFIVMFIGPWPVDDTSFLQEKFAQRTLKNIDTLEKSHASSKLMAGFSQLDMTPKKGIPLGGYAARDPKANEGYYEKIYAKALTLKNATNTVTIVNTETLLPLPELIEQVLKDCKLKREDIFFTSTHTHSGPGGYATGFIEREALGEYSAQYFKQLTTQITKVILASRQNLQPAEMIYSVADLDAQTASTYAYNQLKSSPSDHASLHILQIKGANQNRIANIISFDAHPTFFGRRNKKVSGDYPSLLMDDLQKQFNSPFIFIPGA
ncbi:MAG: neutral/alkaline non-lysosomal ceramidase N-terminal domain-containing protein, partial [Gammaproteobacteria bacterium]|nr:neutral/alkaline non-lysosomal ceramidase N-terminal domain-containing protein [Gammaproteobacteria bacterium]